MPSHLTELPKGRQSHQWMQNYTNKPKLTNINPKVQLLKKKERVDTFPKQHSLPRHFFVLQSNENKLNKNNLDKTNPDPSIAFWNCSGQNRLHQIDSDTIKLLTSNKILCFTETWSTTTSSASLPSFFNNYSQYIAPATKEKSRGRASGGLLLLIRNNEGIRSELVSKSNLWLIVHIVFFNLHFILGVFYFKPDCNHKYIISLLNDAITELTNCFTNMPIILIGDFNARIGLLNQYEEEIFFNTAFSGRRRSMDGTENERGRLLNACMQENGFIVLNGRSQSDSSGEYTFLNHVGKSVIDLCWVNLSGLDLIENFNIHHNIHTEHEVITLSFPKEAQTPNPLQSRQPRGRPYHRFRWNAEKLSTFTYSIRDLPHIYFHSESPSELSDNLQEAILLSAMNSEMFSSFAQNTIPYKPNYKPWYNSDCIALKNNLKKELTNLKKNNFPQNSLLQYNLNKKYYKNKCKYEKRQYFKEIAQKISQTNNNIEFWKTINSFRLKNKQTNDISPMEWLQYLRSIYSPKIPLTEIYLDARHPFLDTNITLNELMRSLSYTKNSKTPGPDGITSEFYKNLTPEWHHYLLNLFNTIFTQEKIPKSWTNTHINFIHKKGCSLTPDNYRPIALMNTITKIFTRILYYRISDWADTTNTLPEEQFGFRKNRSTTHCLFALSSIISIKLRQKGSYLYGIFIDFKRAFDSVQHNLLWSKLHKLGLSYKMIKMLQSLYEGAYITVPSADNGSVKITEGVLQGDILSPLLFSLFLADICSFFYENGVQGINIDGLVDLLMLMYADDIVLLAGSFIDAQIKLRILLEYCKNNSLTVNINKTKILPFHRGRLAKQKPFFYSGQQLELVSSYCYLGVIFSRSGKFLTETKYALSKTNLATNGILRTLVLAKCQSWEAQMQLYESIAKSVLLYGAEIWGLNYSTVIETGQLKFIKRILQCSINTPNYFLRVETGIRNISIKVWEKALRWWAKILGLSNNNIIRIIYNRLVMLDNSPTNLKDLNWATSIKNFLQSINSTESWTNQCISITTINELLDKYSQKLLERDILKIEQTTFNPNFKNILTDYTTCEPYLLVHCSIAKKRILSQLRLANSNTLQIYFNQNSYKIDTNSNCTICNLQEKETLHHFLQVCPMYNALRAIYINPITQDRTTVGTLKILQSSTSSEITKIYLYTTEALRLRSFICNE